MFWGLSRREKFTLPHFLSFVFSSLSTFKCMDLGEEMEKVRKQMGGLRVPGAQSDEDSVLGRAGCWEAQMLEGWEAQNWERASSLARGAAHTHIHRHEDTGHISAYSHTHTLVLRLTLHGAFVAMKAQAAVSSEAELSQRAQAADTMTGAIDLNVYVPHSFMCENLTPNVCKEPWPLGRD